MPNYRSKYGSKKVTVNGVEFASKKEAKRYGELLLLQKAGKVSSLETQVKFVLVPPQYETFPRYSQKTGKRLKDGKRCVEQAVTYYADFVYTDTATGEMVVEDTKGMRTEKYIIKRKLMLFFHGIKIKEI